MGNGPFSFSFFYFEFISIVELVIPISEHFSFSGTQKHEMSEVMKEKTPPSKNELRAVIRFLTLSSNSVNEIMSSMQQVYGTDAPSRSTIALWASRFRAGRTNLDDDDKTGRPVNQGNVDAVRRCAENERTLSTREISRITGVPAGSIYGILTEHLGLKKFMSRWVPHLLTSEQKSQRVSLASELLGTLEPMTRTQLGHVITADESWFYLSYDRSGVWAKSAEEAPPRVLPKIDTPKVMVTVFWGINGVILLDALPPGQRFNTTYMCDVILPELDRIVRLKRPAMGLRGMKLHFDNARPHTSRATLDKLAELKLTKLPQPPYSPDLSPSDFYLFGYLKSRLAGSTFPNTEALLARLREIFASIEQKVLDSVYEEWKIRLSRVIELGGEYYH